MSYISAVAASTGPTAPARLFLAVAISAFYPPNADGQPLTEGDAETIVADNPSNEVVRQESAVTDVESTERTDEASIVQIVIGSLLQRATRGIGAEEEEELATEVARAANSISSLRYLAEIAGNPALSIHARRLAVIGLGMSGAAAPEYSQELLRRTISSGNVHLIEAALRAIDWGNLHGLEAEVECLAERQDLPSWLRDYASDLIG